MSTSQVKNYVNIATKDDKLLHFSNSLYISLCENLKYALLLPHKIPFPYPDVCILILIVCGTQDWQKNDRFFYQVSSWWEPETRVNHYYYKLRCTLKSWGNWLMCQDTFLNIQEVMAVRWPLCHPEFRIQNEFKYIALLFQYITPQVPATQKAIPKK